MFALVLPPQGHAGGRGSLRQGMAAYRHGNFVQAASLLAPVAELGDPEAQTYLGLLYETGRGVPQSLTQAALWYRRAADQGSTAAQYMLGLLYDKGRGVPVDVVEAEKWLILATAGSNKEVADDRARIRDAVRSKMTLDELDQASVRALAWHPRPEH